MRKLVFYLTFCAWALASGPVFAQVTDAERAAARQLFKEGDDLQRDGKFPEALDKFQRAQQVFSAPTNMLRIAECQAALGRLVESAESYRAVVRTQLPAGSPPAFQTAVDQAKAELSQVEPRVPKLTVQVEPAGVAGVQMQIDGETVPGALIGEAIPLDPGTHKVAVVATGYATSEQFQVGGAEGERDSHARLRTQAGSAASRDATPGDRSGPRSTARTTPRTAAARRLSTAGHGGCAGRGGASASATRRGPATAAVRPLAVGRSPRRAPRVGDPGRELATRRRLEPGLEQHIERWVFVRPRRRLSLRSLPVSRRHAGARLPRPGRDLTAINATSVTSDTSLLGLVLGIIVNPDRPSVYFEAGVANRWYGFTSIGQDGTPTSNGYTAGEGLLGIGAWIPAGRFIRLLPKATIGFGSFSPPGTTDGSNAVAHAFVMLDMAGFYNIDL